MKQFTAKELSTEEGRREYYQYWSDAPSTFYLRSEPHIDPSLNQELIDSYGFDEYGDPRIRIVWADSIRVPSFYVGNDGSTKQYLGKRYKYMRCRKIKGYEYKLPNGERGVATSIKQIPLVSKVIGQDAEVFDLGQLRFVAEMKFTGAELVRMGYYPDLDDPAAVKEFCFKDKQQFRAIPDERGEYMLAFMIEDSEGRYRDPVQFDVERIHSTVTRSLTETDEQFVTRQIEEREKLNKLAEEQEDERTKAIIQEAIIRAQSRPIGRKYYT